MPAPVKLYLASSNQGKLNEFRVLAAANAQRSVAIDLRLLPAYDSLPAFDEYAPTFAENAAGKALHYSRLYDGFVFADDSGLVVPELGGRPGVHSARYAGRHGDGDALGSRLLPPAIDQRILGGGQLLFALAEAEAEDVD